MDDHTLYKSFILNQIKNAINDTESKLREIQNWMASNRLKMNSAKTEVIFFGKRRQLETISETKLSGQ